jgi:Zn-finger nucleic acid-binding protein
MEKPVMGLDFAKILDSLSGTGKSSAGNITESDFSPHHLNIIKKIAGQIVREELPVSEKNCPECAKNFALVYVEDTEIEICRSCKSIWFDSGELRELTGYASDVPSEHLRHRKSKYSCPVCSLEMNEYVFRAPGNVLVDQCPERHGVYLESGELARIFKSANIKLKG